MRAVLYLLLPILFITSCCKKSDCAFPSVTVLLHNYNAADVDTIYVTGFKQGSNFSQKEVDTINQGLYPTGDSVQPLYLGIISQGLYDAEVYIPATKETFRFTDYSYRSYSCDNCFMEKKQISTAVDGCKVNGTYYKETVHIYKQK